MFDLHYRTIKQYIEQIIQIKVLLFVTRFTLPGIF
jgi:hypothetical protein